MTEEEHEQDASTSTVGEAAAIVRRAVVEVLLNEDQQERGPKQSNSNISKVNDTVFKPEDSASSGAMTLQQVAAHAMSSKQSKDTLEKEQALRAPVASSATSTSTSSKTTDGKLIMEVNGAKVKAKSRMDNGDKEHAKAKASAEDKKLTKLGVAAAAKDNATQSPAVPCLAVPILRRGQAQSFARPGAVAVAPGSEELFSSGRLTPSTSLALSINHSTLAFDLDEDPCEINPTDPTQTESSTNGLAEARPVNDHPYPIGSADPVLEGEARKSMDRVSLEKLHARRSLQYLGLGVSVCGIVLATILGVVFWQLNNDKSGDDNASASSTKPATALVAPPTPAPTLFFADEIGLPEDTIAAILGDPTASKDNASPQAEAYNWLVNDPNLLNYSHWKAVQRFALATLYFSTGGEQWSLNEHWLDYDLDECLDWFSRDLRDSPGNQWAYRRNRRRLQQENDTADFSAASNTSACDAMGRYETMILSTNNLDGFIPAEIGLLTKLRLLDLSANDALGRPIPTTIGQLTELRRLSADRNLHSGGIPSELGLLPKVETIYLEHNPFVGPVPTEIGNLGSSLRSLSIQRSGVTGYLPTELYRLTKLQELHVQNLLGITGGTLEGIGALTELRSFLAHDVPFNSTIPAEVGLLTNLQHFNLWNTKVYGRLPPEYWQMTDMKNMDIDDNFLSGTFPEEMGQFSHLESVWMNGNKIAGTFPSHIWGNLKNLTYLKMNGNQVTGGIPTEVGLMTSMTEIWFADMNLTGTIPSEIGNMSALNAIFLHLTNLGGTIPVELEDLPNLELITLSNTSVAGAVPDGLCDHLRDMELTCQLVLGVQEQLCTEVEVKNFSCSSSMLCGCDCGPCA